MIIAMMKIGRISARQISDKMVSLLVDFELKLL